VEARSILSFIGPQVNRKFVTSNEVQTDATYNQRRYEQLSWAQSSDKVELRGVSLNLRLLLANVFQSSRSTFSSASFPSFFAFQEGMWDTQISALLSSPTVTHEPGLSTAYENREAIFRRILHEFGTHHNP
jgi:hypothetical protein